MSTNDGPVHTRGVSFRARAEARQRRVRVDRLKAGHGAWGHWLADGDARQGANFAHPEAFAAALARQAAGKGVAPRTFENMLASQAMCFNLFALLANRPALATRVLAPFLPGLGRVHALHLEHTPAADVFGDQSGRGGVDCDLLLEGETTDGRGLVAIIETKFVEPTFSSCGFRDPARVRKAQPVCADDVPVAADRDACLYQSRKHYGYWQRTDQHRLLRDGALLATGCPFGDAKWQLWVNLALAYEEASRRGAAEVRFAVCAPEASPTFAHDSATITAFRALLRRPEDVVAIGVDALIARIALEVPPDLASWAEALRERYADLDVPEIAGPRDVNT